MLGPHVFVVDSHHHALEAYANRKWSDSVRMVHIDAHADLGVSSLSWHDQLHASLTDLQAAMDSEGDASIAEWIVPLLLRRIVHDVHWVIPSFMSSPKASSTLPAATVHDWQSLQAVAFSKGNSQREVATRAAKHAKVDEPHRANSAHVLPVSLLSYYVSDGDVAPPSPPSRAGTGTSTGTHCTVRVSHMPSSSTPDTPRLCLSDPWALDVCLDYFHCRNHHRDILQRFLTRQELKAATQAWAVEDAIVGMPLKQARALVRAHAHVLGCVMAAALPNTEGGASTPTPPPCTPSELQDILTAYDAHCSPFISFAADTVLQLLVANGFSVARAAVQAALAQQPRDEMDMPEGLPSALWECGPCLGLPHHPAGLAEMQVSLDALQAALAHATVPPTVVTVACSSDDGFVPIEVAEWLLPRLVRAIDQGLSHLHAGPMTVRCSDSLPQSLRDSCSHE